MTNHYYSKNPTVKHDERLIKFFFYKKEFLFKTDSGVFSKNKIDFGTALLIGLIDVHDKAKILDIGCGYGPIGITASSSLSSGEVLLVDINERAVDLARENIILNKERNNNEVKISAIQSDGFTNINDNNFDYIFLNPPIRAGKVIVYKLYHDAHLHLKNDGELWIVIQKKQGALSSIKELERIYSKVEVIKREKGYYILRNIR